MRPIGFSTGALCLGAFRHALGFLSAFPSVKVVELSALRLAELEPLVTALPGLDLNNFAHVAVHAPSAFSPRDEPRVVDLLQAVKARGWLIVLHPDAPHDWSRWRALGSDLCIENMDKRKPIGRTRAELLACFDKVVDASFCLDLGHARQVDPTMTEAALLLTQPDLAKKLRQVHLSEVSTASTHERLSRAASQAFQ